MICSCCGFEIEGKPHVVDNGQKNVCEKCWNSPDMFFPEKINQDPRLSLLSKMAQETGNNNGIVEVTAIKLVQKEIEMYVGKMKITDILNLYELDKFKEEELEGYQRERYEERTSQLVEYLAKSPLAVMPALLVGLRETDFVPLNDDVGVLKIDRKKGAIWIIDGQHRVGGFSKIREQFMFTKKLGASLFTDLMDYELPVVFIDSKGAAEKIKSKGAKGTSSLSAQDIEKTIFFVVNKTQRGISPSLKDALLYSIKTSGIEGLAIVDKEGWRILGAQIAITLNCKENSPLRAKINVSGQRNSGKPIQLNSFVSSLEILFKDKEFSNLTIEDKVCFLESYWSALREIIPQAFKERARKENGEEFGRRFALNINDKTKKKKAGNEAEERYLLLTSLGVFTLHRVARDLLHLAITGTNFNQSEYFKHILEPLRLFDWKTNSSPLSALGGMKGVSKAYSLLSEIIGENKCFAGEGAIADAQKRLSTD
jgi:DGQHR domain-containing protein